MMNLRRRNRDRRREPDDLPRVYIAGPMTGIAESNFPAFHAAAALWRDRGWAVVNPAEHFGGDQSRAYQQYVSADMAALRGCDAIAMLPGWDGPSSRGAVWEREIAIQLLGIPVYSAMSPVDPRPTEDVL